MNVRIEAQLSPTEDANLRGDFFEQWWKDWISQLRELTAAQNEDADPADSIDIRKCDRHV
jgi:hypothetical protein